jgi:WD40 repeat protein
MSFAGCLQVQQQQSAAKRDTRARYLVCPLPVEVTNITPPTNKPNPKLGVSSIAWSPNSSLLATVNENMPHAVWIWDVLSASLAAVLVHISSVRSLAWSPAGDYLAVGTGNSRVYVWTAEGASIVHIPLAGFSAAQLAWAPDGSNFALMDQEAFCCAYVTS